MDSDSKNEQNKQESIGDKFFNDSDISESFRVRYISLQINAINKRLLDYNVRSLYLCVPIIISSFISFKIGNKFWEYPNHICIIF
jgi:hypothetical protein